MRFTAQSLRGHNVDEEKMRSRNSYVDLWLRHFKKLGDSGG